MNINRVILSSNESKEYLNFWPIVSNAWLNLGIKPTLIYTGISEPKKPLLLSSNKEKKISSEIIYINIPELDSAFVAQNIRLLAPALFPNDVSLISDIDDMPLSKKYFQDSISKFTDDKFIIYRKDAVPDNMVSIMWNAAKGTTWSNIFNVYNKEDIVKTLKSWFPENYKIRGENWYFDQIILKEKINIYLEQFPETIIELTDEVTGFNRLNRTKLNRNFNKFYIEGSNYSDFHMPRPFRKYKRLINRVYNLNF